MFWGGGGVATPQTPPPPLPESAPAGVTRGRSPLSAHAICGFSDPAHALWWVAEAFPLL